ncbi:MAG TPA: nucleotidyl transferase AbiEii/AbiGii toxin family protein [Streptosporangiaceae bacterium]|nr:nucleotidyl transferase AbiEii/AbiGii toxin family protein [Streptosporangiaceae bacterium]
MLPNDFHRQVAGIVLGVGARHGFALAGGNALIAHGLVDRSTEDVDLFSDDPHAVSAAAADVEGALRAAGFGVERVDRYGDLADVWEGLEDGLAEWTVTSPSGEVTELQLAHVSRSRRPVVMEVGPVLDIEDVLGGKVAAFAGRAEIRDIVDVAAALEHYGVQDLIGFAQRLDPGLTGEDYADAGRRVDHLDDMVFAEFGLTAPQITALRERMSVWPRD